MKDRINPKYFEDKINTDFVYHPKPTRTFELSPFSKAELQYLRGLVLVDKITNDYENKNTLTKDQQTSMHDFTDKILKVIDRLENGNE